MTAHPRNEFYGGKHVLVTGACGHIGSNLTLALVGLGAQVTAVDNFEPGCGANERNLAGIAGKITLLKANISDVSALQGPVGQAKIVFNLAGELSHGHSMRFPERDLRINVQNQLAFLRALAGSGHAPRVVFAGTRQVYGRARYLPVDEKHEAIPPDYNAVHKLAAEEYHLLLGRLKRIDPVILRLTNVFGPRMAIGVGCQGFLGEFIRRAVLREPITVFGDGLQTRDPLYVDDAVDALLAAGMAPCPGRRVLNVGSGQAHSVAEIATAISSIAGLPPPRYQAFPAGREAIDIGDYVSDILAATSELDWRPSTPLNEAVKRTLAYYAEESPHYLPGGCPLSH